MKFKLTITICLIVSITSFAQKQVTFQVTDIPTKEAKYIGLRGSVAPLSWEKTIFLEKSGGNYTKSINFSDKLDKIEYKFVLDNGKDIQWESIPNRNEIIKEKKCSFTSKWNIEKFIDPSTLPKLSIKELMEDFEIISNAILKVHPGLYRYNDEKSVLKNLEVLKNSFQRPLTYVETFLAMSKFIATIECDHTLVSAYNQEGIITSLIHRQNDKMPFAFKWVNEKMIITHDASDSKLIKRGAEVISINNLAVSEILNRMLPYITADGSTINNKIMKAQIDGYAFRYNAFDVLYPLLFPVKENKVSLKIKNPGLSKIIELDVKTITKTERSEKLLIKYANLPKSPEDLWEYKILENNIGYLKIGTFATDEFKGDWKTMLKEAFKDMKKKKVENLVIDIRENQGGLDDASYELEKYIYQKAFVNDGLQNQSRFLEFPEEVKPYIQTWDYWFYNLKDDEYVKNDIYYTFPRSSVKKTIKPTKNTFRGKIYMLTSPNNVSGAFYLARLFKKSDSGMLIGEETGGNQNGINGGAILFFKPPNSRININLPVLGTFSKTKMPNKGIVPDVKITNSVSDFITGTDTVLNEAIKIINKG